MGEEKTHRKGKYEQESNSMNLRLSVRTHDF